MPKGLNARRRSEVRRPKELHQGEQALSRRVLGDELRTCDAPRAKLARRSPDPRVFIPSIRAMVGVGMSFIYRITVERETPKSSGSDLRDLQHASSAAAAADIFVTHDQELECLLRRVPIKGFRVMRLRIKARRGA